MALVAAGVLSVVLFPLLAVPRLAASNPERPEHERPDAEGAQA